MAEHQLRPPLPLNTYCNVEAHTAAHTTVEEHKMEDQEPATATERIHRGTITTTTKVNKMHKMRIMMEASSRARVNGHRIYPPQEMEEEIARNMWKAVIIGQAHRPDMLMLSHHNRRAGTIWAEEHGQRPSWPAPSSHQTTPEGRSAERNSKKLSSGLGMRQRPNDKAGVSGSAKDPATAKTRGSMKPSVNWLLFTMEWNGEAKTGFTQLLGHAPNFANFFHNGGSKSSSR
ncbi:hypothetical protein M0657_005219 [Pyricularia oryzae]|nr:hypothetical protein M9X92_004650 [Pyricularia oryzae]KAI7923257.1 hypothetical protein M0657_005219 [Pyricularia oryzae]